MSAWFHRADVRFVSQGRCPLGFSRQIIIIGYDGAAVSEGAQVLGGIKAEAAHRSETARPFAVAFRAVGLRTVFDNRDARFGGNFDNRLDIGSRRTGASR